MTRIQWNFPRDRKYDAGLSRGVLYLPEEVSQQIVWKGVAWNGLINAAVSDAGSSVRSVYQHGVKTAHRGAPTDHIGKIEAFTYPEEFDFAIGNVEVHSQSGLFAAGQQQSEFGLSWRTDVGDALDPKRSYKIHILYNALASVPEKAYATLTDSTEPSVFTFDIYPRATAVSVAHLAPTPYFVVESDKARPENLNRLENILYGSMFEEARLPTVGELFELMTTAVTGYGYGEGSYGKGPYGGSVLEPFPPLPPTNPPSDDPDGAVPKIWVVEDYKTPISSYTPYNSFPDAVLCDNGTIVTAYSRYQSHYGPGYPEYAISDNNGSSFYRPPNRRLHFPDAQHVGVAAMASLGNRVVLLTMSLDTPSRSAWIQRADDWVDGLPNWQTPKLVEGWAASNWIYPSDVLWFPKSGQPHGVMLITSYGPDGVIVMRSLDAGETFTRIAVAKKGSKWQQASETTMLRLPNGHILMLIRNDDQKRIEMTRSTNEGVNWSSPTPVMSYMSGLPRMTMMSDGTILVTLRDETPGKSPQQAWAIGDSLDWGLTWNIRRFSDDRMMYGRILSTGKDAGLLIGAHDERRADGPARSWASKLYAY